MDPNLPSTATETEIVLRPGVALFVVGAILFWLTAALTYMVISMTDHPLSLFSSRVTTIAGILGAAAGVAMIVPVVVGLKWGNPSFPANASFGTMGFLLVLAGITYLISPFVIWTNGEAIAFVTTRDGVRATRGPELRLPWTNTVTHFEFVNITITVPIDDAEGQKFSVFTSVGFKGTGAEITSLIRQHGDVAGITRYCIEQVTMLAASLLTKAHGVVPSLRELSFAAPPDFLAGTGLQTRCSFMAKPVL